MSGSEFPSLSEYHARQRAVAAEGEAARANASARGVLLCGPGIPVRGAGVGVG